MNITPAQTSFSAGELSPLLYGRVDADGYQQGLRKARNMICDARGPSYSRTGGRWIGRENGDDVKVINMEVDYETFYQVSILDGRLTVNLPEGEAIGDQFDDATAPWTEAQLPQIQTVRHPSTARLYIFHPNVPTQQLDFDGTTWTLVAVSFTAQPAEWTGTNWPRTGTFFGGRFYLGGTPNENNTFWASKSGTDHDFTIGTADADAFKFTMRDYGAIHWMEGIKNLLIGSENGEYIVTAEGGVITPSDVNVDRQSSYGSYIIQADQVGDQMIYTSPDQRKIRAMQFDFRADNWLSRDITFFSEHITKGKIRDTSWAQNPDNLFICVLESGDLAIVSYDRGNDIYGWHLHSLVDGKYLSVTSGNESGVSRVIVGIQRNAGSIDFEEFNPLDSEFYMDGWVSQEGSDLTKVTGLGHFEGETVQVWVDEATHPDAVVSGGEVTLEFTGDKVAAGKGYEAWIETLPMDQGARGGSGRTHEKRHVDLSVLIEASAMPLINGQRPPTRSAQMAMDEPPPLLSELVRVATLGYDQDSTVVVKQDLNQPLMVLGLYGKVSQDRL